MPSSVRKAYRRYADSAGEPLMEFMAYLFQRMVCDFNARNIGSIQKSIAIGRYSRSFSTWKTREK